MNQERTCALSCIYSQGQIRVQQWGCDASLFRPIDCHTTRLLTRVTRAWHPARSALRTQQASSCLQRENAPAWIESALWERQSCTQTLTPRAEVSRVAQPDGSASRFLLRLGGAQRGDCTASTRPSCPSPSCPCRRLPCSPLPSSSFPPPPSSSSPPPPAPCAPPLSSWGCPRRRSCRPRRLR